jgi:hypothetical protein
LELSFSYPQISDSFASIPILNILRAKRIAEHEFFQ